MGDIDATRVLAHNTMKTYYKKDKYSNQFSPEFRCNRLGSGKSEYGYIQVLSMKKKWDVSVEDRMVDK